MGSLHQQKYYERNKNPRPEIMPIKLLALKQMASPAVKNRMKPDSKSLPFFCKNKCAKKLPTNYAVYTGVLSNFIFEGFKC